MVADKRLIAVALAVALAKPAEGLYRVAYYDPVGVLSTCYGTTGPEVMIGKVYSMEECNKYLDDDMKAAVAQVDRCVPGLPVEVLAAFGDAVYNLGATVACDANKSTAARLLKAGYIREACLQLYRWNKGKVMGVMVELRGLTKRRATETEVCLRGVA